MKRLLSLALLLACPVADGFGQGASPPAAGGADVAVPEVRPGRAANPLWEITLNQLASTRQRPLFSASRRPLPPAEASPAPVYMPPPPVARAPERPSLALVGTIIGEQESFGIFLDTANRTPLRLRPGDEQDGWVVRSIESREAVLEKRSESVTLAMPKPAAVGSDGDVAMSEPQRPVVVDGERRQRQIR